MTKARTEAKVNEAENFRVELPKDAARTLCSDAGIGRDVNDIARRLREQATMPTSWGGPMTAIGMTTVYCSEIVAILDALQEARSQRESRG